jgi:aerobic carbon-monoxide dehydrogenase medium subunit
MLEKLEEYHIPQTIAEAVRLLRRRTGGETVAITGAIDLHWWRLQNARRFVDTSRLGLNRIRLDRTALHLGAATLLEDIVTSKVAARFAGGLLVQGALGLASPPRRHTTSLAALLINAVSVVDIIPALMALDAKVRVQGVKRRTIPLTEIFAGKGRAALDRELLLEVVVPKPKGKIGVALERHALTPSDDPMLTAIATVQMSRGKIAKATIAIGGGLHVPVRCPKAEAELVGKAPDLGLFACAAHGVAKAIHPISDTRCSAEHRRDVCKVIVRRALARAAGLEESR